MALPDSNNEVTARKLGATISAMWTKIKSTFAPISHTHGNITNAGALQTTDVSVANGDKLVVTDASNSNKVARTSVTFDGSTTTKALTPKGTFETFLQSHQDISGKEDKSNKVTAWQSTPDNTHYPSEKLVKDSIDERVPATTLSVSVPANSTKYVKMVVPSGYHHYLVFFNASQGVLHAEWLFRSYGDGGTARTTVNYIGALVTARKWYVAGSSGNTFYIEFVNTSTGSQSLNFKVCALDISDLPTLTVESEVPSGYVEQPVVGTVASQLLTARNLAVSLSNTSTDTPFDGHAAVTNIKTTGTLGIGNGGTGATTKKAAEYAINGDMAQATAAMADNFQIVFSRVGSDQNATNGVFIYRTALTVWNYIKDKISSVLGLTATEYGGNAATATTATTAAGYTSGGAIDTAIQGKQDSLAAQTAYTAKGSATKVPQITTNSLGQVTGITEVTISGVTPASHTHGNITNAGGITASGVTIANGDSLAIVDSSETNKLIAKSSVTFDGSTTTKALTQKGTFETFYQKPSGGIPDTDIASASTWNAKQNALTAQTAYTSKGSATKVPQITTNSLGQVTGITEVTISHQDISGKEDTTNKVTSWSSTTNDTHYPSEKLVKDSLDLKAPLASPTFTGTPKAPTATAGTNTTQIATTAFVKSAVDTAIADVADALVYKGTIAGGSTGSYGALTAAANKGYLYKVSAAGKIDGVQVEVGDMIICNADNTAAATSSNYTTIAASWDFIQTNIEGYVLGPSSSVDAHVATFNGTTGNTIQDSGYTIATSVPSGAVFTDTKVTSSGNHYTPSTASGSDKSASATGATAEWGIDVVKGVTLNTDGKGHVTGISVTSGKIPSNPNTDTKVKATAKTDNVNYKILATASASPTSGNATEAVYDADITLNPSTNTIAANISGDAATASAAKSGSTLETTINGKQDALTAQTAYSAKGSATKVPQITTNSLGQVTGITEVTITGVTPASHTHGNITNAGGITATGVTIANGDSLAIVDSSETNKLIAKSSVTFDGSTTTKALTQKGTFETFYQKPSTGIPDSDIASASTWSGKQDALTAQTAYSAKGSATKVPQITTNSLGQVTGITEVTITGVTPASHTHGNITNAGGITATGVAIANGDSLVIVDSSETNKLIKQTSITFDGSTTTKALTQKGTFETFQTAITYMTTAQETAIVTELGDLE